MEESVFMMNKNRANSLRFIITALYNGALGIFFLFDSDTAFPWFQATPSNHLGYVHFPAALLIVFAFMFIAILISFSFGNSQNVRAPQNQYLQKLSVTKRPKPNCTLSSWQLDFSLYPLVRCRYLILCGWSASAPSLAFLSASYSE